MPIGHAFIELGSVDSTNNYAMAQVHAGTASHGAIFFAHEQWAGKGQRGKTWASAPGENIMMTVILEPVFLPIASQFYLNTAISLSCHDFFSRYAGPEQVSIKWPNDLYWRDRKAGGILIENSFRSGKWRVSLAGIGININQVQFPESLRNPVSLRQITGRKFSAVELAKELAADLDRRYRQLQAGEAEGLLSAYNNHLYKRGKAARLRKDLEIFETLIRGVSANGDLLTGDAAQRRFTFGEVEWMD